MNLRNLKNDRKLEICRWYFRAGFLCLPFIWFINAIWFFNEAFRTEAYEEQKTIKKYVILSGLGAIIWGGGLLAWVIVYQTHRAAWGEFGDDLTLLIPHGIP